MSDRKNPNYEAEMSSLLAGMPRQRVTTNLSARLRASAASEARRRRLLTSPVALGKELRWRLELLSANLTRPYALPMAGGVASALFLFLSIAPAFPIRKPIVDDVPVRLTTPVTLQAAFLVPTPAAPPSEDVVLDLDVDSAGRVVNYSVASGHQWTADPAARRSLELALVYTRFNPATLFGKPQSGTLRITIRRSELEVRG